MTLIHPTAIVDTKAELADDVMIGPYCIIGPDVVMDKGVILHPHVIVQGQTHIGSATEISSFACLGNKPQDLKFAGEDSRLEIGADTTIREHATLNPGTEGGGLVTKVGDRCVLMIGSHVGHDTIMGNDVILSNNVMLAGHCKIEDFVIVSGGAGVHQFTRIGRHAFVGGMSGVENDVIPYGLVLGNRAHLAGLNIIGLKRRGFTRDQIKSLRAAYRMLFSAEGTLRERMDDVSGLFEAHAEVAEIIEFIRNGAQRSLCTPRELAA